MSPEKEGYTDAKETMQPPNQKGRQWGDNGPTSAAPEETTVF